MADVLNEELLDELRQLMGDDLKLLIETYRKDTEFRLSTIQQALDDGALSDVIDAAHSLKGSSSNVGAVNMEALCHQIVQSSRAGSQGEVVALFPQLCAEYDRVMGRFARVVER
ncbi:Hpt domain-containing protein [Pseudoteredinibacter isoporae]|uniref:HPt (Histidine-containing phosphotransfer) domain-containing protein n=1 Tax=Pseudoteredinibacter isoporae TaxID=570281 RepID=A0A7X0JX90_9GAMM|nr:Hpt domain-containing protein [Pseudoteredinibacter isoporae]MBB6523469.1 HPt (histidine-containing phosphotransfer) domain-containing protein [Pseudoteredinibacter isoporae]NHO88978.1 Hpt domain-containing protein [Pseudoteredinibacter isoporae]NIB24314.1 Hpt domain-containing protein [Pseudoteredinibacter isoporae]